MSQSGSRALVVRLVLVAIVVAAVAATHDLWKPLLANSDPAPRQTAGPAASAGLPVIVAAVGERADTVVVQAIGTARAINSVILYPEANGEIIELAVAAGDAVAKDDVILRLDNRNAVLAVELARTHLSDAESALERTRALRRSNVKSDANVRDDETALERARLELRQAQVALADRTLRAPFAGVVGIPKVEAGDRVTTDTAIATLDDRSALLVEFEVAERYFSRLSLGMPIRARTPSFPDRLIEGQIAHIDSRIDPVARTALVRASFPNPDDTLRPGMSLGVTLDLIGPVLATVPELAIQWRDGRSYVWRITDGVAERVDVQSRRRLNQTVLVEGDIHPGDVVVVEGVQRLRPGAEVLIAQTPEN
ncbi:MAG: efflux RND transporter periplasmic adaptor subunit [Rhodospirillales bacterium]